MRFTEFLIEAPKVKGKWDRSGKFLGANPVQPKQQMVRGPGGRFVPKPALDPQQPRPQQSVDFHQDPNVEPVQPQNQGKPRQRDDGTVDFQPDPNVEPVQQKNKPTPWQIMLKKAGVDNNAGREFITLLGAMYQAKRVNPSVQLKVPKLVTSLPDKTPEQQELKKQMATLFQIAQSEDLPQLAARSKELQTARMNIMRQTGGKGLPPKQQPSSQQPDEQQSAPEKQSILQQLSKLSLMDLKAVSHKIKDAIKTKKPKTPNIPPPGQQNSNQ